jgi:hypothetical protein
MTKDSPLCRMLARDRTYDEFATSDSDESEETEDSDDSESENSEPDNENSLPVRTTVPVRFLRKRGTTLEAQDEVGIKFYTFESLTRRIQKEYPDALVALPNIDQFHFETWEGKQTSLRLKPSCDQRIRIGAVANMKKGLNDNAYMYIGGDGANRTGLSCGLENKNLFLNKAYSIEPIAPFKYLCQYGRFIHDEHLEMLRAFGCYLFLAAGHIETIRNYRNFVDDLQAAAAWLAYDWNKHEGPSKTDCAESNTYSVAATQKLEGDLCQAESFASSSRTSPEKRRMPDSTADTNLETQRKIFDAREYKPSLRG